jgi:nucleotide-binding universal stress UspA family protein
MPEKILVAYDGSDCADVALAGLSRAGLPEEVEAQIVSVAEVWLPPSESNEAPLKSLAGNPRYAKSMAVIEEAERLVESAKKRLKSDFPKWNVSSAVRVGSPAWELVFVADQWKADLIVVGSKGQTALSRVLLGSVSERVLAEARCSVRIARGKPRKADAPMRIIIGVDGSSGSEAAVKKVSERVWPAGSEIQVVLFDDPLVPSFVGELIPMLSTAPDEEEEERSWAERVLNNCAVTLQRPELKVTTAIRDGNPKSELSRIAEDWEADCIFVGSTGFSNQLERFVLGSVSEAVAARAGCAVEVVRARKEGPV